MSETDQTLDELLEGLNGWEELAVERATGLSLAKLIEEHPQQLIRAMVALDQSRDQLSSFPKQYSAAMEMPLSKVNAYFADVADVMPDAPDSESGKGDLSEGDGPGTSPGSV